MTRIGRRGVLIATLALAALGCGAGKPPRSLHEPEGGFSFDPPPGWQVSSMPGAAYRVCLGPEERQFTPNINVVRETFVGSLDEYVAANLRSLEQQHAAMNLLRRENFRTRDGERGVRLIMDNDWGGRLLRQTFFVFASGTRHYIVTCTALADGGDALDQVFADSIATFRLH